MAAGSSFIQFRVVNLQTSDGQVAGVKMQVRTKDIVKHLGNLVMSDTWSEWQDINAETVVEHI